MARRIFREKFIEEFHCGVARSSVKIQCPMIMLDLTVHAINFNPRSKFGDSNLREEVNSLTRNEHERQDGKMRTIAGKPKISLGRIRTVDIPVYLRDRSGVARSLCAPGIRLFI
jgi:hypothetical protein